MSVLDRILARKAEEVAERRASVPQAELEARIEKAGIEPPKTYTLEHGYCRSVYVEDPDGMIVEFTCDDPRAAAGDVQRKAKAHDELKRWLAGDHTSNNDFRHAEAA